MSGRWQSLAHQAHVWLGAGTGLILLLLCLSGSMAVFRMEIGGLLTSSDKSSPHGCALGADAAFKRLHETLGATGDIRRLSLPAMNGGYWELRLANGKRAAIDACGNALSGEQNKVADYLVNLHTRLFLGKSGRWIVGSFGVLLLLSVITGVLVHRRFLKQLFTLRTGRSLRLRNSDAHKLLGSWLLPFLVLTALSGAWLGIATLFNISGDKGVKASRSSAYVLPTELDPILRKAAGELAGIEPVFIDFFPAKGQLSVRGNLPGHLVQRYSAEVLFAGADGALLGVFDPRSMSGLPWWHQAMMPLHIGDWSGLWLRVLYCLLGLGSTLLIWLGLWLWANRRMNVAGTLLKRGALARYLMNLGAVVTLLIVIFPLILLNS